MHEKAETIIGAHTFFKGDIETDKPLRIDGKYEGKIHSESAVIVSEDAEYKGEMICRDLLIAGMAEGTIICKDKLEFSSTGNIVGEVTTKNLVIVPGAQLNGRCNMYVLKDGR